MQQDAGYINDYHLIEIIGKGAYANVYLAVTPKNKKYALKMIETKSTSQDKIREEGMLLASMRHPNLLWAR